eukprot:CAMPEP_0119348572 /NCGR_PEP_ID=MMETSP1333-20130426/109115_1 /TAXON_ID=418940 /ORGANISM="Scyphosphaera apsteinii, Strain RCC1455" /LENGTH=43 /DNA_ID= /DNA_START= /DNA_END= /DNA_ORIENTATION=
MTIYYAYLDLVRSPPKDLTARCPAGHDQPYLNYLHPSWGLLKW